MPFHRWDLLPVTAETAVFATLRSIHSLPAIEMTRSFISHRLLPTFRALPLLALSLHLRNIRSNIHQAGSSVKTACSGPVLGRRSPAVYGSWKMNGTKSHRIVINRLRGDLSS